MTWALTFLATEALATAIAAGLAGGASIGYLTYRYARPEYIIE